MEEQKASLKRAIAALPSYEAPSFVWNEIDLQLEDDLKDRLIDVSIPHLKNYAAPKFVWDKIEKNLGQPRSSKLITLNNWRTLASMAASLLILMTLAYQLWPTSLPSASYTAYTEPVDQYLLEADWDTDEATFAQVVKMYDDYSKTFKDRESIGLKAELLELNEARKELKTAIDLYGNDHELIRQLAALERDRTQVIKKMAFKI